MHVPNALMTFGCTCCLVTTALQTISFGIPGWLVLEVQTIATPRRNSVSQSNSQNRTDVFRMEVDTDGGVHRKEIYAVWYIILCQYNSTTLSGSCVAHSYMFLRSYFDQRRRRTGTQDEPLSIGDHNIKLSFDTSWGLEVTGGLICAFLASVLLIRVRMRNNVALVNTPHQGSAEPSAAVFVLAAVAAGISCVFSTMSVVKVFQVHAKLSAIAPYTMTKTGVPYGLIVAAIGTVTSYITILSMGIMFYNSSRRSNSRMANLNGDQWEVQTSIPMLPVQGQGQVGQQAGYARPLIPQYTGYPHPHPPEHVLQEQSAEQ